MSSPALLTGPESQPADPATTRRTATTAARDAHSDRAADDRADRPDGFDAALAAAKQQARTPKPRVAATSEAEVRGCDKLGKDASVSTGSGDEQVPVDPAAAPVAVASIQIPDAALLAASLSIATDPLAATDPESSTGAGASIGAVESTSTAPTVTATANAATPAAAGTSATGTTTPTAAKTGTPATTTDAATVATATDTSKIMGGAQQAVSSTSEIGTAATQTPAGLAVAATTATTTGAPTTGTPVAGADAQAAATVTSDGTPVSALPATQSSKLSPDRRIDANPPAGPIGAAGSAPSTITAVTAVSDTKLPATTRDAGTEAPEATPGPLTAAVAAPALVIADPKTGSVAAAPPAPVTDQIAAALNQYLIGTRMLKDGTHRAVIRLAPEHLGEVTVTLDVRGGSVRIDLIAGPQAIGALRADLGDLHDQLAQSGLQLDDVSLSQSGSSSLGTGSQGSPERWNGAQSGPNPFSAGNQITKALESAGVRPIRHTDPGRLDVLI